MAKVLLPEEHRAEVLKKYTYYKRGDPTPKISYKYKNGTAMVPINMDKLKEVAALLDARIVDQRGLKNALQKTFTQSAGFSFRDYQIEPAASLVKYIQENRYGTFVAGCGTGKTVILAYAAGVIGHKTLILIDQSNLMPNWIDAFRIIWNEPVQVITSKTQEFDHVGITTFQLLHRNEDLLYRLKDEYGMLLVDECHGVTAATFTGVMQKFDNQYRIATSATFFNKNLPTELLIDCCGAPVCVTMEDKNALIPRVDFIPTYVDTPSDSPDDWSKTLSYLAANDKRNSLIIDLVREDVANGRHVVVICITQEQARYLSDKCNEFCTAVDYVGTSTTKKDLDIKTRFESGELDVVFTCKKLDKGTDFTIADVIIMTRPGNNRGSLQQLSGRVVRKKEGKPEPIIRDLVDRGSLVWRFAKNRHGWYSDLNYTFVKDDYFFLDMF